MQPPLTAAKLEFDSTGTPLSKKHGDIYFSSGQGLEESRYVFLQTNQLPNLWKKPAFKHKKSPWTIAETGFGTGLNFFLTAALFLEHADKNTELQYISFEKHPLNASDILKTLGHYPEFSTLVEKFIECEPPHLLGTHRIQIHPRITLDLIYGDALITLPDWANNHASSVHTWYLDGFAPSKNPDMWHTSIYRGLYRSLKAGGTFATFTAAGHVKRGLEQAGLTVFKQAGFGHKRDMLYGFKQTLELVQAPKQSDPSIAIVGDGIAAACLATQLIEHPGPIQLFWPEQTAASGASGNPQGAVYPGLQASWSPTSALYSHAFYYAKRFYQAHCAETFHPTGVLLKAQTAQDKKRHEKIIDSGYFPTSLVHLQENGLYYPSAGWILSEQTVQRLFQQVIEQRTQLGLTTEVYKNTSVESIHRENKQWHIQCTEQATRAEQLVFCTGYALEPLSTHFPKVFDFIEPARGQITCIQSETVKNIQLNYVLCGQGYVLPPIESVLCTGSGFDKATPFIGTTIEDTEYNLAQINRMLATKFTQDQVKNCRAGVRAMSKDHLPLIGEVIEQSGLYVMTGLGARGFTSAPWLAYLLACEVQGLPTPIGSQMQNALHCQRLFTGLVV